MKDVKESGDSAVAKETSLRRNYNDLKTTTNHNLSQLEVYTFILFDEVEISTIVQLNLRLSYI